MKTILLALAVAACAAVPLSASAQAAAGADAAVLATVHQFLDGFNNADTKTMLAVGSDQMSIIDEFPPHEWHGTGAFAQWIKDYDLDAASNEISDGIVTLGTPSHVDITGDRAYVVMPANYTFKRRGKPEEEVGSIITVTLLKGPAGWRITGWAWAKH